ncbi:MAG: hypothetical protein C5B50_02630 [Verrucomicrobia bacterium]|nr:MAG: hypothetical protein C5B50_02630 [Verrucomicrobiota bacterium]
MKNNKTDITNPDPAHLDTLPAEASATADRPPSSLRVRRGKIARLPNDLRDKINQRLLDGQEGIAILDWLNSLPEVRSFVDSEFDGYPLSPSNLTEWKQGGYRDWLVTHNASTFLANLCDPDSLAQAGFTSDLVTILSRCLTVHYAACAQNLLSPDATPRDTLDFLRRLTTDLSRLRRSELDSKRLELDDRWLNLEQTHQEQRTATSFLAWADRPEVKEIITGEKDTGVSRLEKILKLQSQLFKLGVAAQKHHAKLQAESSNETSNP